VGYLCANFILPRPLYSRLSSDVRVRRRQTSDAHYRLMPSPIRGGGIMRAVNLFFNRMFNAIENVTVFTAALNISYKLSSVGYRVKAQ